MFNAFLRVTTWPWSKFQVAQWKAMQKKHPHLDHTEAGDFFQEEHHLGRNLFGEAFPQMIPREAVLSTTMGIESQQKHATRLLPAHFLAVFCLSGS